MYKKITIALVTILALQLFICFSCKAEKHIDTEQETFYRNKDHDEWFAKDKFKHLTLSMLLAGIGYVAVNANTNDESSSIIAGASFSIGIGLLKEFKDLKDGKFWSNKDLIWDVIGAGVAVSVASYID